MAFKPTKKKFRRDYNKLFRRNPADEELTVLIAARFEDPRAYQLPGGAKR